MRKLDFPNDECLTRTMVFLVKIDDGGKIQRKTLPKQIASKLVISLARNVYNEFFYI